ncbi:FlgO family outer membrane protein [Roseovarius aestuariivivens]|uniref:FlgO family outer membrane protein n=1 Tax=Roseovarius aestuariivivens TaxID=1888910 RepID=UPI001081A1BD|nr:FlgO family outer membrane protein [Roseovarius aestuariivivens]
MTNRVSLMAAAVVCAGLAGPGHTASSVDGSLDEIAGQIVDRTRTDGRATIGISTFTHSDGTCSDLSNYISEFIVDSLFNSGEGKIDIIERSQLSAIFREMELVFDGTIAPDAAKRLGEIEGVDAVVTGSLIQFGEQVKVQARMISTEDGRLFATARSDFPSVGSVAEMMVTRSRGACGFATAAGSAAETVPTTQVVVMGGETGQDMIQQSLAEPSRRFSAEVFEAEVSSLIYAKSSGDATFAVRFKNTTDNTIALSYMPDSMSLADGQGGFMTYKGNWSGLRSCYGDNYLQYCNASDPKYATTLPPGKVAQLNFQMTGEKGVEDPRFTLALELVVTPNIEENDSYSVQSIGFYDMPPDS